MAQTVCIGPISVVPENNTLISPGFSIGASNSRPIQGIRVAASLSADRVCYLLFRLPDTLASTPNAKLRVTGLAQPGATQNARVNCKWNKVDPGTTNYDTVSLTAEGAQTIAFDTAADDIPQETDITLDANTIAQADGGELLYFGFTFETTSWTLAVESFWFWELIVDVA